MGRRGIALVSVLLLASVLLAMMLALYIAVRGDLFFSQAHNQSVAALYAAEAGLADCMIALEGADYNLTGTLTQTLSNGASYTIEFNDTAPFTSTQSVNNLLNPAAPVESYRGPASVPASAALIVVRGRSGGVERVLEAVVSRAPGGPQLDAAVQTSGTLQLGGGIDVNGITSMTDATPVPAVLHSNAPSGLGVAWDGSGTANIQGSVSARSSDSGAIDLGGYNPSGGTQTGAAGKPFPAVDIPSSVSSKAGTGTSPTFVVGGVTTLSSDDFYVDGGGSTTVVQGDLVLDGGNLYVEGDLVVNGSITGEGSVFVNGTTEFKGDASVIASGESKVALYSEKSVTLSGFDGTAYLNGLAASDPTIDNYVQATTNSLAELQDTFVTYAPADFLEQPGSPGWNRFHEARRVLGADNAYADATFNNYPENSVGLLADALPAGTTADFLRKKLDNINLIYHSTQVDIDSGAPTAATNDELLARWMSGTLTGDYGGIFDAIVVMSGGLTPDRLDVANQLINITDQVDYDRIGSAHFQGVIYTHGFVYAAHEISIVGALYANGDPSQNSATIDGKTIKPGDVYLANGTSVTFVKEFFDDTGALTVGPLGVEYWLAR